jgi:hypothetical protein
LQWLLDPAAILDPSISQDAKLSEDFRNLMNSSVTGGTWGKYSSAFNAFTSFEAYNCTSYEWPLSTDVCRAFVVWGKSVRKWQHTTIKAYLAGLKFIHHLKGLQCSHLDSDPIILLLLKGAEHQAFSNPSLSPTRRVVTFPMLLLLANRIAKSDWDQVSKQVIYTAATTAFFASTRLGEILASAERQHSLESDLLWEDVMFTPGDSILLRLKQPKSGAREGEYVDLFKFPGYKCCPVKAMKKLRQLLEGAGQCDPQLPVFRFKSGANLTMQHFNGVLAGLLSDVCKPGTDSISCHSFRAGIPSTLSLFPDLASEDHIKGWGRWKSDAYKNYTRLQLTQREGIFGRIAEALRTVHPLQPN